MNTYIYVCVCVYIHKYEYKQTYIPIYVLIFDIYVCIDMYVCTYLPAFL